jgi:hypothetical protein
MIMHDMIVYFLLAGMAYLWWHVFTKKDTDSYDSGYSFMWVLWTPFMLWWLAGIMQTHAHDFFSPQTLILFMSASFFGPVTLIVGILKAAGFGNTKIGHFMGFAPPARKT